MMHMWGNVRTRHMHMHMTHAHDMHTHMHMQHAVHCAYISIYVYVRQYRNIFPMWALARYARHKEIGIKDGDSKGGRSFHNPHTTAATRHTPQLPC